MTTQQRDYYEVLGVARDADERAIKDAFRQLALRYHPDRNKEPDAEERFKEIAEAYAVLSDPKKRADYDTGGFAGVAGFSPEDLFSHLNFKDCQALAMTGEATSIYVFAFRCQNTCHLLSATCMNVCAPSPKPRGDEFP